MDQSSKVRLPPHTTDHFDRWSPPARRDAGLRAPHEEDRRARGVSARVVRRAVARQVGRAARMGATRVEGGVTAPPHLSELYCVQYNESYESLERARESCGSVESRDSRIGSRHFGPSTVDTRETSDEAGSSHDTHEDREEHGVHKSPKTHTYNLQTQNRGADPGESGTRRTVILEADST